ncbi:MAG TPA: hypothetical protein VD886_22220 [Herpetosiphonaceae bacterium]|nr:hypothetical protein [Herpetosiphonaceae bacterium]
MPYLSVSIRRFIMEHQPNIVEAAFVDAWGQSWAFHDKDAIFTTTHLDAESCYPQPGIIACEIIGRRKHAGRQIITITTEKPWGVESTSGDVQFDVFPEQMETQ